MPKEPKQNDLASSACRRLRAQFDALGLDTDEVRLDHNGDVIVRFYRTTVERQTRELMRKVAQS